MRAARTLSTLPPPDPAGSGERSPNAAWTPPEEFDDYVVLHRLGSGGMGHVYLGEDTVLARRVAIKFIAAHEPDAEALQRFLIEARAAGRVQHPNVVSVYRVGEHQGRPYIVSEFARGQPLDRAEVPMPWRRALEIGVDLARGLAAAHRNGVLHCDIKPQNAIVTEDGIAKLLDFGLARLSAPRDANDADGTSMPPSQLEAMVRGTPDYMAPEVWRGEPPGRRSDIYSLGALLHELVSGSTPFADVDVHLLPRAVQLRDPRPLLERAPSLDPRFTAIVDRCLRRLAPERYASGDELRAALEQLARGADAPPPPAGNPYRGLRAFDADHRALFFGRSAEIGVVLDRLRNEHFLLITGESGVGKSSLCRAGVLPAITEGVLGGGRRWGVCTVVPGKHPAQALANALAPRMRISAPDLAAMIQQDRHALARELARELGEEHGLVLFLDQTEELLTVSEARERRAAEEALAVLAMGVPGVRLLSTLRADFLTRFAALPSLGEDLSRVLYFLRPMSPERTREVIVGPAEATGLEFESEEMIQHLVQSTSDEGGGGLPLLQFALAELWEARDPEANMVRASALEAMGGVGGALARHADTVVVTLPAGQRDEARRMLMRLVTLDDTRVRRTQIELRGESGVARDALDALVRGRLLVAHEDENGSAYELAHEVLIRSWTTLRRWLAEAAEARSVRERLATAAAEWKRLGRTRDTLWNGRQLGELDRFPPEDTSDIEAAFVAASRGAAARGRWIRRAAAVGIPLALGCAYGGAQLKAHRDLTRRVDVEAAAAQRALETAQTRRDQAAQQRAEAFARFDGFQREAGEAAWSSALGAQAEALKAYRDGSRRLEAGLALDPTRTDVRTLLANALFDRALVAELERRGDDRDELVGRFQLYDDGKLLARWNAPAKLTLRTDTPNATAALYRSVPDERGALRWEAVGGVLPLPLERSLEPGSYLAVCEAEGRAPTRIPAVLARGGEAAVSVHLPNAAQVPVGFVYVERGRFLFGAGGDEASRKGFYDTVPVHEVETGAYLIAQHEVTWGQWLEYLSALPADERDKRTPRTPVKRGDSGFLELSRTKAGWVLEMQPAGRAVSARAGEPLRVLRSSGEVELAWERLPVAGISAEDAEAYTRWLDATGRVRGARLCTEYEWERGARGADGREYPQGAALAPQDANIDETYGKEAMGPAEVGSFPASNSAYGLSDMSGNVFEWTTSSLSAREFVNRGGSYFYDAKTARTINRAVSTSTLREASLGMRVCASPPERSPTRPYGDPSRMPSRNR